MDQTRHLDKESARNWLKQRQTKRTPLPGIEQIRCELGWKFPEQQVRKPHR